jgi:hypothetical protein
MTPQPHRAGQYARHRSRLLVLRVLVGLGVTLGVGMTVGVVAGFTSPMFLVTEAAVIGGMLLQDRLAMPILDRWERGVEAEKHVG